MNLNYGVLRGTLRLCQVIAKKCGITWNYLGFLYVYLNPTSVSGFHLYLNVATAAVIMGNEARQMLTDIKCFLKMSWGKFMKQGTVGGPYTFALCIANGKADPRLKNSDRHLINVQLCPVVKIALNSWLNVLTRHRAWSLPSCKTSAENSTQNACYFEEYTPEQENNFLFYFFSTAAERTRGGLY